MPRIAAGTVRTKTFVLCGIAVAVLLALLISPFASSSPDGFEKVAAEQGIDAGVDGQAVADSPLADDAVQGVDDSRLSTALAGVVGVGVTFAVGFAVFASVRMIRRRTASMAGDGVST